MMQSPQSWLQKWLQQVCVSLVFTDLSYTEDFNVVK